MGKQASNLKGYNNVFARNLRKLMERKDITQEELAKKAGCSRQAVSQYMDGSSVPNVDKLLGIADYFGVSIDYLLGRKNEPNEIELKYLMCDYTGLSLRDVEYLHDQALAKDRHIEDWFAENSSDPSDRLFALMIKRMFSNIKRRNDES